MKKIYLNAEFECSVTEKPDTALRVETDIFEGKCDEYIEGYRFVPDGKSWVREDSEVFWGEMVSPCSDSYALEEKQKEYDKAQRIEGNELWK